MVNVLIVDDSPIWRGALREALEGDPEVRVVGEAADGVEAIRLVQLLRPSLITLDLQMPKLGGLQTIEWVMKHQPTPIVVVTERAPADREDVTFAALARGALEVMSKSTAWNDGAQQGRALVTHLKRLARPERERPGQLQPSAGGLPLRQGFRPEVVAVGASTGGPAALRNLLQALPTSFALPVLLVQHMDPLFHDRFATWLAQQCQLPVTLAEDGEVVCGGRVYLAPGGRDLAVNRGRIWLRAPEGGATHAPSVNRLFESVAASWGPKALGILLTGMGADGARGLKRMRDAGGWTVAQDQQSSAVWGMPGQAVALDAACEVLSLDEICAAFRHGAGAFERPAKPGGGMEEAVMERTRIMVVDDSPVILEATRMTLEEAGYEVFSLDNPLLVASAVRRDRPDLVLIDVNMPAVTGDVVTQIIAQHHTLSKVKVVLFSDLPRDSLAERAKRCGASGFVRKTGNEEELLSQVRSFL